MAGNDLIMGGYPTTPLAAAVLGHKPIFDPDGAVHQDKISMYGGIFHKKVEAWGCFLPQKEGADTVSAVVAAGKKLSPHVQEWIDKGVATVCSQSDGTQTVTYRGTDRGAYLPLEDVQRSAERVLRLLVNGAPMKELRQKC